jgi:flagellar protein FlaI
VAGANLRPPQNRGSFFPSLRNRLKQGTSKPAKRDEFSEETRKILNGLAISNRPLPTEAQPLAEPYPLVLSRSGKTIVTATLAWIPSLGRGLYYITEPTMTENELATYVRLMYRLKFEMRLPATDNPEDYRSEKLVELVENEAAAISTEYGARDALTLTQEKLLYFITRDLAGYGAVDALIRDTHLEDIKFAGYDVPAAVIHREYSDFDYLDTNILLTHNQLDSLAKRLSQMVDKTLSIAFPYAEGTLPSGDRVSVTYATEISPKGTMISIRLFSREPFTVIHFLERGLMSPLMASYIWTIVESKGVLFIIGTPGAGKTTLVNAICMLFKPNWSPVTIEDIPELNVPQQHHTSLVTRTTRTIRESGGRPGEQQGDIPQEALLRQSLRIRPDFLIVGEILTKEAPTFVQAANVGLGGLTSFHALSVEQAVNRLLGSLIGIDPAMLYAIDAIVTVQETQTTSAKKTRRITAIGEIRSVGDKERVGAEFPSTFKWDPVTDTFSPSMAEQLVAQSVAMKRVMDKTGKTPQQLAQDLRDKANFLTGLQHNGIRSIKDVSQAIQKYYAERIQPTGIVVPTAMQSGEDKLRRIVSHT